MYSLDRCAMLDDPLHVEEPTLEEEREDACATTLIRIESDPSLAILKRKHDFADISSVPPPISTKPWFLHRLHT